MARCQQDTKPGGYPSLYQTYCPFFDDCLDVSPHCDTYPAETRNVGTGLKKGHLFLPFSCESASVCAKGRLFTPRCDRAFGNVAIASSMFQAVVHDVSASLPFS
jgi:hypothetical protein